MDNIVIKKIWEDDDFFQIAIRCSNSYASVTTDCYVKNESIDDLIKTIEMCTEEKIEKAKWSTGEFGNESTSAVSFEFYAPDIRGHLLVEVCMEIDDGGDMNKHIACFFVKSELGLLIDFAQKLTRLKKRNSECMIALYS